MSYFAAERQYKGTANKEIHTQPQPPTRLGEKYDAGSGPSILAKAPDEKVACMLKIASVGSRLFSEFEKEAAGLSLTAARAASAGKNPGILGRAAAGVKNIFKPADTGFAARQAARAESQAARNAAAAASTKPTATTPPPAAGAPAAGTPAAGAPAAGAPAAGAPASGAAAALGGPSGYHHDAQSGAIIPTGISDPNVRELVMDKQMKDMGQRRMMEAIEAGGGGQFSGMDKFKARAADMFANPYFQTLAPMAAQMIPVGTETTTDEYGRPVKRTKTLGETSFGSMLPLGMLAAGQYRGPLQVGPGGAIFGGNFKGAQPAAQTPTA